MNPAPTPTLWTRLRAAADPFTRRTLGLYSAYALTPEEYVTTCGNDNNALGKLLADRGYEPARLSAAKRHPATGRLHVLSMRRRPETHPFAVAGTALEGTDPRRCQFHVHAMNTDVSGFVDVFAHYEYAPDLRPLGGETWREALARCRAHYRPTWDREDVNREEWTYLRGVEDPEAEL